MGKIEEAQEILAALGLPTHQQNEMSAMTLLALCNISPSSPWKKASRHRISISKGIMEFVAREYGKQYAPNTRETFRRQVLHQFVQAHIVDYNPFEPDLPTNSPRAHYAITEAAVAAIRTFGTKKWRQAIRDFILQQGSLLTIYEKRRTDNLVPIRLPKGKILELSPGSHNELQRAVIEQFAPRFAKNAELLYLGDTAKKTLFINNSVLDGLRIAIMEHEKLPDVMLYQQDQDRVFLVEAVTSHGPMSPKRVIEFEQMLSNCTARRVFVSAFPDFQEFRRHLRNIAWETEVWLAEIPDHLIHFNGDRFLPSGPTRK